MGQQTTQFTPDIAADAAIVRRACASEATEFTVDQLTAAARVVASLIKTHKRPQFAPILKRLSDEIEIAKERDNPQAAYDLADSFLN